MPVFVIRNVVNLLNQPWGKMHFEVREKS